MNVIVVGNQKGGTAKTTTAVVNANVFFIVVLLRTAYGWEPNCRGDLRRPLKQELTG